MTQSLWMLLGFAAWTLTVLMVGVGVRRWGLILTGRANLTSFPADTPHGSPGYRRAMRAHAKCVENLPVFGAIVLPASAAHLEAAGFDQLAAAVLAARVAQSSIHMALPETNRTVAIRFAFFLAQIAAMIAMLVLLARAAL